MEMMVGLVSTLIVKICIVCLFGLLDTDIVHGEQINNIKKNYMMNMMNGMKGIVQTETTITLPIVPAHVIHERRQRLLRQLQSNQTSTSVTPEMEEGHPQQVDALYQGYGEHYVDLWCGSPPQRQTVILNTGARGTAFPCNGCFDDCGLEAHTDAYFDETRSLSFEKIPCKECQIGQCQEADPSDGCQFGIQYVEGSAWWAYEVIDECYIGGLHNKPLSIDDGGKDDLDPEHAPAFAFPLRFGCQTLITGYFRTQLADGILGMNKSPYAFWQQMYDAKMIKDKLFSLCYTRQPVAEKNGTQSGAMTLGGSDDRLHLTQMVFTRQKDTFGDDFGVLLRRVHLRQGGGGNSARSTNSSLAIETVDITTEQLQTKGHIIVESGTTGTYFTKALAQPFRDTWRALTNMDYTNSRLHWTNDQIQQLPTILIQLEGDEELNKEITDDPDQVPNLAGSLDPEHPYDVILAMPPQHYMRYNAISGDYESMFFTEEPMGTITLGANAIMGHDVLFDVKNNRLGWAESNCDYDHLLKEAGLDETGKDVPPAKKPVPPPTPASSHNRGNDPAYTPPTPDSKTPKVPYGTSANANNNSDNESSSSSSSSSSWTGTVVVVGMLVVAVGAIIYVRNHDFGMLTIRVRRFTGASDYRNIMPTATEGAGSGFVLDGSGPSELELQVSDARFS